MIKYLTKPVGFIRIMSMTTQTPTSEHQQRSAVFAAPARQKGRTGRSDGSVSPRGLIVVVAALVAATALVMVSLEHGTNADALGESTHIVR